MSTKFYVTTPIYYVNAEPHIGHIYSTLIADVYARWARQCGKTTLSVTGTDEHGQKIQERADGEGLDPRQLTDRVAAEFRNAFTLFGFSHNVFIRTTDERHVANVERIWKQLKSRGFIYLGQHEGWYSVSDETFCLPSETVERDGERFSKLSGHKLVWHREQNYMFRLSQFRDRLLDFYHSHPDWITPSFRQTEVVNFVNGGLHDLSVSRRTATCSWGVPVPDDPDHTVYVWLDALSNYLSATLFGSGQQSPASIVDHKFWPCDLHVIGKDILKFHAVYWPAFLMALDLELPKKLLVHGWWTLNGQKISKSLGNVFDPWVKAQQYSTDALRYYLLRDTGFGGDGDFSDERMTSRLNSELADKLGNLVTRVLSKSLLDLTRVPADLVTADLTPEDKRLINVALDLTSQVNAMLTAEYAPQRALDAIWRFIDMLNRYLVTQQPWVLKRQPGSRYPEVMTVLLESVRFLGELLAPFIPDTSEAIRSCFPEVPDRLEWGQLRPGHAIRQPETSIILFEKK